MNTALLNVVHRAATDPSFHAQLQTDLRQALISSDIALDEETIIVLEKIRERLTHPLAVELAENPDPGNEPDWTANISFTSFALGRATN